MSPEAIFCEKAKVLIGDVGVDRLTSIFVEAMEVPLYVRTVAVVLVQLEFGFIV
jgi:hypothetical protein